MNIPNYVVPFKISYDYFVEILRSDPGNLDKFPDLYRESGWTGFDCDLHYYPYISAGPLMLSAGCKNRCFFCDTAEHFKGKVYYGDAEKILSRYQDAAFHFMDEDFFANPAMDSILKIFKRRNIKWLAMTTHESFNAALDRYGEDYLAECGLRCVELGLENIALFKKVGTPVKVSKFQIYYLNLTCLPGETKETIRQNADWMRTRSLRNPIHFHNALWFCPGLFFFPMKTPAEKGLYLNGQYAKASPTWVPETLLAEDFTIRNLEKVNYYSHLMYRVQYFPEKTSGNFREFVLSDSSAEQQRRALWALVGLRVGGIT